MFVYVLNCHGEHLMPCRPRKARILLKAGKATVVKMVPFTLQLRYGSSGYTQEVLATRRQFRRARRNRKTRYRPCRLLNRRKPKGWLAPSVRHLVEAHLKTMRMVHRLLPVRRTIIEVAQFDLQKIQHPEIEGRAYQEGPQLGFWNVREYVVAQEG